MRSRYKKINPKTNTINILLYIHLPPSYRRLPHRRPIKLSHSSCKTPPSRPCSRRAISLLPFPSSSASTRCPSCLWGCQWPRPRCICTWAAAGRCKASCGRGRRRGTRNPRAFARAGSRTSNCSVPPAGSERERWRERGGAAVELRGAF